MQSFFVDSSQCPRRDYRSVIASRRERGPFCPGRIPAQPAAGSQPAAISHPAAFLAAEDRIPGGAGGSLKGPQSGGGCNFPPPRISCLRLLGVNPSLLDPNNRPPPYGYPPPYGQVCGADRRNFLAPNWSSPKIFFECQNDTNVLKYDIF